jgi:transposase InsO family protein
MSDHDQPVAANLLDLPLTAEGPNQRWVGDTTEFVIGEISKLYLAPSWTHVSRRGNRHDAVMESFFSTLKAELADRFESCGAAQMQLFDLIEPFCNKAAATRRSARSVRPPSSDEAWRGRPTYPTCPRDRIRPTPSPVARRHSP